jgi:hypothetical protein
LADGVNVIPASTPEIVFPNPGKTTAWVFMLKL